MVLRLALTQCLPARLFPGRATVQAVPAGRAVLAQNWAALFSGYPPCSAWITGFTGQTRFNWFRLDAA